MLLSADMLCLVQSFQQAKDHTSRVRKFPFIKRKKLASASSSHDENLLHPENARESTSELWSQNKQGLKHFSGSAPSMTCTPLASSPLLTPSTCRSRQKKFLRHFNVDSDEKVIDYFSCALVADILLQGHLYISKNYFGFYSNVFGYVTKLLIPTSSVVAVTKEKTAFILPNAVGVTTTDDRHVFSSLLSRDTTYRLMVEVWREAHISRISDTIASDLEADESLSEEPLTLTREAMLDMKPSIKTTESTPKKSKETTSDNLSGGCVLPSQLSPSVPSLSRSTVLLVVSTALLVVLFLSATVLLYRVSLLHHSLYSQIPHNSRSLYEVQAFLETNLKHLHKVRQNLEILSLLMESEKEVIQNVAFKKIENSHTEESTSVEMKPQIEPEIRHNSKESKTS